jgi:transcriptional regulator with XRE-family HTH domain
LSDKGKPKVEPEYEELAVVVKKVREAYRDTQEAFARRIGVSPMTISRFELGKQVPRDPLILLRLYRAAMTCGASLGLHAVPSISMALYRQLGPDWQNYTETWPVPNRQHGSHSLSEWRLQCVARIALKYHPEEAIAIEKAAPRSMEIVDAVLREADAPDQIDDSFYEDLDQAISGLADKQLLQRLQEKRK